MSRLPYLLGTRKSCRSGRRRQRPHASCPWCCSAAPTASSRRMCKLVPLFLRLTWPFATGEWYRVQMRPCNWNWWGRRRGRVWAKSQCCLPGRLELATLKIPSTSASECLQGCRPCGLLLHVPGLGARNAQLNAVRVFKALSTKIYPTLSLPHSSPLFFVHSHIRQWLPQSHDRDVSFHPPH
jgi:hypothetical protein